MKTILVTGGCGFIGSHFIRLLLQEHTDLKLINIDRLTYAANPANLDDIAIDPRYIFIHGDICDKSLVNQIFLQYQPDLLVNFAAESHVDNSILAPMEFQRTNTQGTLTLLNAAKSHWTVGDDRYRSGVRFLQVSTDEVYGSLGEIGLFTEDTPLSPRSPYSASKAAADLFVGAYRETYRLPTLITRCSNNYGPCQHREKLIPLLIHNALEGKPLPVYGDGMQIRDWLYVVDHCRAIQMVLKDGHPGSIYNIGGNTELPNLVIIDRLLKLLRERGFAAPDSLIHHVTDRKGHDRRYGIDHTKITHELGWNPIISFDQGLAATVDWYLSKISIV